MSHFSAIGFDVSSGNDMSDDINAIIEQILSSEKYTEHGEHEAFSYLCYTDPSGAQIWLTVDNKSNELINVVPCFVPKLSQSLAVSHTKPILDGQYGDGAVAGYINPDFAGEEMTYDYPVMIDVPDYLNHIHLDDQTEIAHTAFLTLFAEDVVKYDDEEAFNQSQTNHEAQYASQCFIPLGMFNLKNGDNSHNDDNSTAIVLVSALVIDSQIRANHLSGNGFYWCLLQTYGGQYEAVFPIGMFDDIPQKGDILFGEYWLTGRFAEK